MECWGDGFKGIKTFYYSLLHYSNTPWPRPACQMVGRPGMQQLRYIDYTPEVLQRHHKAPEKSRQGRPSFHMNGMKA